MQVGRDGVEQDRVERELEVDPIAGGLIRGLQAIGVAEDREVRAGRRERRRIERRDLEDDLDLAGLLGERALRDHDRDLVVGGHEHLRPGTVGVERDVEHARRRWLIGRGEVGGRVDPAVRLRGTDAVEEGPLRERREMPRQRGERGVDGHEHQAGDDRLPPAHHASDALGSIGSVANAGGQMTAASPGATHFQITLAAATLSPAFGVPGAPNSRPLPFGRLPRGRSTARAAAATSAGAREDALRKDVGEERPCGGEAGERCRAHVLIPLRVDTRRSRAAAASGRRDASPEGLIDEADGLSDA